MPKALPGKCHGEIRVWALYNIHTQVWLSWDHCISCTCTPQTADMCLESSSGLLCIRWSTEGVCAVDLRGIPLRTAGLLVNWCVHEQGTFVWAFQATRGQQGLLGCCSTTAEKAKILLPFRQNFQVGPTSAPDTPALLSLQGESLGCPVPLSATCPGAVCIWDSVVLAPA